MIITASFTLWILNCWWCYCCLGYCCHTICPPFCRLFLVHFGQRSHSYYAKECKFLVGNYSKEWWGGGWKMRRTGDRRIFRQLLCVCVFFLFLCFLVFISFVCCCLARKILHETCVTVVHLFATVYTHFVIVGHSWSDVDQPSDIRGLLWDWFGES